MIWDLDGIIADTAPFQFLAGQRVAPDRGTTFTEADFRQTFGKRNPEIIAGKFEGVHSPQEIAVLSQKKEEIFRQ